MGVLIRTPVRRIIFSPPGFTDAPCRGEINDRRLAAWTFTDLHTHPRVHINVSPMHRLECTLYSKPCIPGG